MKKRLTTVYLAIASTIALCISCTVDPKPADLVLVSDYIPDIELDIKYATDDNFTSSVLYDTALCYLAYETAQQLKLVQDSLRNIKSFQGTTYPEGLGIKIWDGFRPISVQFKMWEIVPDENYVANPHKGSSHNRGAAVDLTLIDFATKKELNMPTTFDYFGPPAHHDYDSLSTEVLENRKLLKELMEQVGGFSAYKMEWWHYSYTGQEEFPIRDWPER